MNKSILLFLTIFQFGCNYSLSKTPLSFTGGTNQLDQLPAGTVVSYQVIATSIMKPRCLECHSNAGGNADGINLETYENVTANLGIIKSEIENGKMPKNREKLTAKEKAVLFTWIDAGAPKDGLVVNRPTQPVEPKPQDPKPSEPTPNPDVEFISYEMVHTQVLQPRCISCHSEAGGNRGKTNLETYENVIASINAVESEIQSGSMPRPRNKPLTDEQKTLILKWIANGAPKTKE